MKERTDSDLTAVARSGRTLGGPAGGDMEEGAGGPRCARIELEESDVVMRYLTHSRQARRCSRHEERSRALPFALTRPMRLQRSPPFLRRPRRRF